MWYERGRVHGRESLLGQKKKKMLCREMKKSSFYNSVENQIAHSDKSEKKNGQEPFCHVGFVEL